MSCNTLVTFADQLWPSSELLSHHSSPGQWTSSQSNEPQPASTLRHSQAPTLFLVCNIISLLNFFLSFFLFHIMVCWRMAPCQTLHTHASDSFHPSSLLVVRYCMSFIGCVLKWRQPLWGMWMGVCICWLVWQQNSVSSLCTSNRLQVP